MNDEWPEVTVAGFIAELIVAILVVAALIVGIGLTIAVAS